MRAKISKGKILVTLEDPDQRTWLRQRDQILSMIGSARVVSERVPEVRCDASPQNLRKLRTLGCKLSKDDMTKSIVSEMRSTRDEYEHEIAQGLIAKKQSKTIGDYKFKKPPYPHQIQGFNFLHSMKEPALFGDCGTGKMNPVSTPVLTPTGWVAIGDLSTGDLVIARDGQAYPVTGVHRQGVKELFRVTFSDGASLLAGDEHQWLVQSYNNEPWRTMRTEDLRNSKKKWQIPRVEPIQFSKKELPVHPYTLGVRLKGESRSNAPIPDEYLFSSPRQRLSLLKGFFEEDLELPLKMEYSNPMSNLVEGFVFLVESLGGVAVCVDSIQGNPEQLSVTQSLTSEAVRLITSIEPAGDDDCVCISVGSPDRTYVCDRFVVTHNTFIVLTFGESLIKHHDEYHGKWVFLVVCPVNLINHVWGADSKTFTDLRCIGLRDDSSPAILGEDWDDPKAKNLSFRDRAAVRKERKLDAEWQAKAKKRAKARQKRRLKELFAQDSDFYVVNPENIRTEAKEKHVKDLLKRKISEGFKVCLVIDESSKLKSRTSRTYRSIKRIRKLCERCIIMTGTPSPNGILDLWAQFSVLDGGKTLQPSFSDYRNDVASEITLKNIKWKDKGGNEHSVVKWKPKVGAALDVYETISPRMIRFKTEDCVDIPPKRFIIRDVTMNREQASAYQDMEKMLFTELEGESVTAKVAAVKLLKLRQITGGFLRTDEQEEIALGKTNPKADELDDLLEQSIADKIGDTGKPNKALIWAQYRWECRMLVKRYSKYGARGLFGGISSKAKDNAIARFKKDPNARVLVCHPGSVGHGLTLVDANYGFYYSLSHNFEEFYQSFRRNARAGQKRNLTYYFLVCPGTVDDKLLEVVQDKKDLSDLITDGEFNAEKFIGVRDRTSTINVDWEVPSENTTKGGE